MPTPFSNETALRLIFFAGIFATFLVFYTNVVPIVIYNLDDWVGLAVRRDIFPIWRGWNPSRILPELMMPLTAQLSAYLIYPVTGRFLYSIEIGLSVAVSAAATVYAFFFLTSVVGLVINELVMWLLRLVWGEETVLFTFLPLSFSLYMVNKVIATGVAMIWNYYMKKRLLQNAQIQKQDGESEQEIDK